MLAYDADLELFRDNFKRFMNEHIAPHYDQWEREGIMPRSVWNQLGENGFLCVDVPEEYGGAALLIIKGKNSKFSKPLILKACLGLIS